MGRSTPRVAATVTNAETDPAVPRDRPATLADVGRVAGVSPATASRVLNGTGTRVAESLRLRVLEAARELDYVPNAHAQALMRKGTDTVGILAYHIKNPYFTEITSAIFGVASETGRLVTIGNVGTDPESELRYIALLRSQRAGALILAGSGRNDPEHNARKRAQLDAFRAGGGRVAFIGDQGVPGDVVAPDNLGGASAAARALLEMGHTEVGVLAGDTVMMVTSDRLNGFTEVYADAGHPIPPERIALGHFVPDRGAEAMAALLDRDPSITAVFCLNDAMAVGALRLLRERGIDVPGRMSVVGFDDVSIARVVTPALSTVQLPLLQMGETAMRLVLSPPSDVPRTVLLPTKLCLRESTAPRA
jgi:LacI family transcriptional regulator